MGLIMTEKFRLGLYNVGPFRESFPPPFVVLRDRMELGKIESNGPRSILFFEGVAQSSHSNSPLMTDFTTQSPTVALREMPLENSASHKLRGCVLQGCSSRSPNDEPHLGFAPGSRL